MSTEKPPVLKAVGNVAKDVLGWNATDTVTGMNGTITGIVTYLTGCDQIVLTPKLNKDGEYQSGRWFDINRMEINADVERVVIHSDKSAGPGDIPPNY